MNNSYGNYIRNKGRIILVELLKDLEEISV